MEEAARDTVILSRAERRRYSLQCCSPTGNPTSAAKAGLAAVAYVAAKAATP